MRNSTRRAGQVLGAKSLLETAGMIGAPHWKFSNGNWSPFPKHTLDPGTSGSQWHNWPNGSRHNPCPWEYLLGFKKISCSILLSLVASQHICHPLQSDCRPAGYSLANQKTLLCPHLGFRSNRPLNSTNSKGVIVIEAKTRVPKTRRKNADSSRV